MNGYERTIAFVEGKPVDRPPFVPLAIEWVARQEGLEYPEFVYDPLKRAAAYTRCVERFHFDCVLPDADFYEQLEDVGAKPEFSSSGFHAAPILTSPEEVASLPSPTYADGTRMGNRLLTLREVAKSQKGRRYIFGICIGPFTEYTNARGVNDGLMDFLDETDSVAEALQALVDQEIAFIERQLEAGADGIQIVEPSCSLVSPAMYDEFIRPAHTRLVEAAQRHGGVCRLHICGDTNQLLPYSAATGAKVLDVDYQVDLASAVDKVADQQFFCGNVNPSGELLEGNPENLAGIVERIHSASRGRTLISSGCDVPPDTPAAHMDAFYAACSALSREA